MLKILFAFCGAAMAAGCLGPGLASPQQVHQMDMPTVCEMWLETGRPVFADEIRARSGYKGELLDSVIAHRVYVGMDGIAATCAWGNHFETHTTVVGNGAQVQLAYYNKPGQYLYIGLDKKVAAYQN